MSDNLILVEQKAIDFYGDELVAVRDANDTIWVPVRRLCEAMGLNYAGQAQRIERDAVMSEEVAAISITVADGRAFDMTCLPLKYVRGWLFSINANRVKDEIRAKLIHYQREVIEIIDRAFTHPVPSEDFTDEFMAAMQENAHQQMKLWAALRSAQQRLRYAEELVQEHDDMLQDHQRQISDQSQALGDAFHELFLLREEQGRLLAQFHDVTRLLPSPNEPIGPQQKARLKELVNELVAVAKDRGIQLGKGRSDFPAVWGAFNQRFRISKYSELQTGDFDEAVHWLEAWQARVKGERNDA